MIEHEDEIDDILAKRLMRTLCKVKMLWRMLCIVSCILAGIKRAGFAYGLFLFVAG